MCIKSLVRNAADMIRHAFAGMRSPNDFIFYGWILMDSICSGEWTRGAWQRIDNCRYRQACMHRVRTTSVAFAIKIFNIIQSLRFIVCFIFFFCFVLSHPFCVPFQHDAAIDSIVFRHRPIPYFLLCDYFNMCSPNRLQQQPNSSSTANSYGAYTIDKRKKNLHIYNK